MSIIRKIVASLLLLFSVATPTKQSLAAQIPNPFAQLLNLPADPIVADADDDKLPTMTPQQQAEINAAIQQARAQAAIIARNNNDFAKIAEDIKQEIARAANEKDVVQQFKERVIWQTEKLNKPYQFHFRQNNPAVQGNDDWERQYFTAAEAEQFLNNVEDRAQYARADAWRRGMMVNGAWVEEQQYYVNKVEDLDIRIGLHGKDLLKAVFLGAHSGVDYLFYNILTKHFHESLAQSLIINKTALIALLRNLQKSPTGEAVSSANSDILKDFFNTKLFPPIGHLDTLGVDLFPIILVCFLNCQFIDFVEHKIFPADQQGEFGSYTDLMEFIFKSKKVISPYLLIEAVMARIFGFSRTVYEHTPFLRKMLLSLTGWNHKALNSYTFYLLKTFCITLRFVKQAQNRYQQASLIFLENNSDIILNLLEKSATGNSFDDKKAAEEELATLISKSLETSFLTWLRFKFICFNSASLLIEGLLITPALYEGAKCAYKNFV